MSSPGFEAFYQVSVVVPTRNEAGNIAPLLARLETTLAPDTYEVIFVDDSTDATPSIITGIAAEAGTAITLIHRPSDQRNGLSGAVVEGITTASGEWVCVMDADLQHPPEAVAQLLNQAERTGADLVVASRRADFTGPMGLSRRRAFTSQSLTILARSLFPRVLKNVSDPLTGFFMVRRSAIDPKTLQPEGFKILLEILVRHPELHVSEVFFDFAPRNEGQSKADLNEGIRYFRHLTRLRWTVNRHLARFLLVILLAVGINTLLLTGLVGRLGWPLLAAAALAGGVTIAGLLAGEAWVFNDRSLGRSPRRMVVAFLLSSLYLIIIYLPMVTLLSRLGLPYWVAALLAFSVAGFIYYLFSEYWIWTRGLIMRPRSDFFYDIHGLLNIASQVPLIELNHFETADEPARIDLQLRVDRHGTPSLPSGALTYDEHLGRLGFSLAALPGEYSEIVVSPLLESSPSFLYTNVVEPILHWMLVTRGYAFLPVAAVATRDLSTAAVALGTVAASEDLARAILLSGAPDMAHGLVQLASIGGMSFMADDRTIVAEDGLVRSFPKPVTVNQSMLSQASAATRAVAPLAIQRLVYSQPVRQFGIWLGTRRLPAATFNTYLQRIMPQPKYDMSELAPRIQTVDLALADKMIFFDAPASATYPGPVAHRVDELVAGGWLAAGSATGFQPLSHLASELAQWAGTDWIAYEQTIAQRALSAVDAQIRPITGSTWWEQLQSEAPNKTFSSGLLPSALAAQQT